MQIKRFDLNAGIAWLRHGWALSERARGVWLALAAIYLAILALLNVVPFLGPLVVTLLTPLFIAGAMETARESGTQDAGAYLRRAWRFLTRVLGDADRTVSIMVVSTLLLGADVVIRILAQLLHINGAAVPAYLAGSVSASIGIPALLNVALVWLLRFALMVWAPCAVYLIVLRNDPPLRAMEMAAKGVARNALAFAPVAVALLLPLIIASHFHILYAGVVGRLVLPVFMGTAYTACREMYG